MKAFKCDRCGTVSADSSGIPARSYEVSDHSWKVNSPKATGFQVNISIVGCKQYGPESTFQIDICPQCFLACVNQALTQEFKTGEEIK